MSHPQIIRPALWRCVPTCESPRSAPGKPHGTLSQSQASDLHKLMQETTGYFEKLTVRFPLFPRHHFLFDCHPNLAIPKVMSSHETMLSRPSLTHSLSPSQDGTPPRLGSWQVLWWQPRWYHAELDAFCHQPISTTEKPTGKACKIMYKDIEEIELRNARDGKQTEFVIHCGKGSSYAFKASSEEACACLVNNLRELHTRTC